MSSTTKSHINRETASFVRLCIDGWVYRRNEQENNFQNAHTLLKKALRKSWPTKRQKVEFAVLPGGFIFDKFPEDLNEIIRGWNSDAKDFVPFTEYGEECINRVLTKEIIADLAE